MKQKTRLFLRELQQLQERHGLAVVPTYEGTASLHDPLIVVKLDICVRDYMQETKEEDYGEDE